MGERLARQLRADAALADLLPANLDALAAMVGAVADPVMAASALGRIASGASGETREVLKSILTNDDDDSLARLLAVLGASAALGDEIARRPELVAQLHEPERCNSIDCGVVPPQLFAARIAGGPGVDDGEEAVARLRRGYRAALLRIAADDLTGDPINGLPVVTARLTALAEAAIQAALEIAIRQTPGAETVRFAVIGMGKLGARELNYVSDVDLMYVVEPEPTASEQQALDVGARIAASLGQVLAGPGSEPPLWPVDVGLRPEGKHGPMVRTLDSYQAYYQKWAKSWEFQALLKSRAVAGDAELGARFRDVVRPMVWQAATREGFVADTQAMRRRVERHINPEQQGWQIKLGAGGLRDIEFTVQLIELVHGRTDSSVRHRNTLDAIGALAAGGYIGRDDGAELARAYKFLRALEHRVQLYGLKRTHLFPQGEEAQRRLARSMADAKIAGQARNDDKNSDNAVLDSPKIAGRARNDNFGNDDSLSRGGGSRAELLREFQATRRLVRALHERLYYRPLLPAHAQLSDAEATLTPEAAQARLAATGYLDPAGAMRHVSALTAGGSRRAALQRQLLPALLGWLGEAAMPDYGLLAFRRLSDQVGSAHWFLKLLRDSGTAAQQLAHLLGNSRYLGEATATTPEVVQWLAEPDLTQAVLGSHQAGLAPLSRDRLMVEADQLRRRAPSPDLAVNAIRALRGRELARVAAAEVLGEISREQAAHAISDLAEVALLATLDVARGVARERLGLTVHDADAQGAAAAPGARGAATTAANAINGTDTPDTSNFADPAEILVVAMGRLGGRELNYASDADVVFVAEPAPGVSEGFAVEYATAVVAYVCDALGKIGPEPALPVDTTLRPEGKNGPVVRTLASYAEYLSRWHEPWEAQALLRARPLVSAHAGPVAPTEFAAPRGLAVPAESAKSLAVPESLAARFIELIDPVRYPAGGLPAESVTALRRIKARMDATRLPGGVAPERHLKLGPGGLTDVEWAAQLLQLRYAATVPGLRTTSTIGAIDAARDAEIIDDDDAATLRDAWTLASELRAALTLATGKLAGATIDVLPAKVADLAAVAGVLGGYRPDTAAPGGAELVESYLRAARRARKVAERVLFDDAAPRNVG